MDTKFNRILNEIHLYSNKLEMLIKVGIWIISWIGGIRVLQEASQKETLGSAYFIFTLSLLMEFAPKIMGKKEFWSKVAHTIFCLSILLTFFMAVGLLLGGAPSDKYYIAMYNQSKFALAYMIIDFLILWLSSEDMITKQDVSQSTKREVLGSCEQVVFEDKLFNGNLGSIDKGERHE